MSAKYKGPPRNAFDEWIIVNRLKQRVVARAFNCTTMAIARWRRAGGRISNFHALVITSMYPDCPLPRDGSRLIGPPTGQQPSSVLMEQQL